MNFKKIDSYCERPSNAREAMSERLAGLDRLKKQELFLTMTASLLYKTGGKNLGENTLFCHDVQELDGFKVGFMHPGAFFNLCKRFDLNPHAAEAIMMQAEQLSEPHVHRRGSSLFLPLGADHGYPESRGGTFMGPFEPGRPLHRLEYQHAFAGRPFQVKPGMIHCFQPEEDSVFTAIAFVDPKIKKADGSFDMLRFPYAELQPREKECLVRL